MKFLKICISVLIILILVSPFTISLANPGFTYRLEGQKSNGNWTTGLVTGWTECNDVPYKLTVDYDVSTPTLLRIDLFGDYKDTESPPNYGIDYFKDFEISGDFDTTPEPTIDGNTIPYPAGSGTGTEVDINWGGKEIRYTLEIQVSGDSQFELAWFAHLAKGGENGIPLNRGASNWTHDNIHVREAPQDDPHGARDVPIARPEGEGIVLVDKTMEAEFITGYAWTLSKTADPESLTIPIGNQASIVYTITATKEQTESQYRIRGTITITNYFDKKICIDVLDQVQTELTDYPDSSMLVDNAIFSWNNLELPKATGGSGSNPFEPSVTTLYVPGPDQSDWFELTDLPDDFDPDTELYNLVWIGYNPDAHGGGCPEADPESADWDPADGADYDNIASSYYRFEFNQLIGENYVIVEDIEDPNGPFSIIEIIPDPLFNFDINDDEELDSWKIDDNSILQITKRLQCEGPGSGIITNIATAIGWDDVEEEFTDFSTSSNIVTVNVDQLEPSIQISKQLISDDPTKIGSNVIFEIVVTNNGDTQLTDVDIIDTYDTNYLDFVSATPVSPVESPPGTLTWNNIESQASGGTFDPGDIITLTVNFNAIAETPEGEDTENCASVTSGELDEGPVCDSVEINEPGIDIRKALTSSDPAIVDETVTFQIEIENTGSTILTDVDVTDTYDTTYLEFTSATPVSPVESPPGTLTWNNIESQASGGTFDPGDIITLTVNFNAIAETPEGEDTENCASVTSGELDEGPVCDSVEINELLVPQEDEFDFGDAPDPTYPTLLINDGARHIIGTIKMGSNIDSETDGQPTNQDDILGDSPDDEDGVTFLGAGPIGGPYSKPYMADQNGAVQITVSGSITLENPAYLHGWIDWNQDGDWEDPNENIFSSYPVYAPGDYIIEFHVPTNAKPGGTWARFRLDDQNLNNFKGLAQNGEVEDYYIDPNTGVPPEEPNEPIGDPDIAPVGGIYAPINKLSILLPYLSLIAFIGAITIIYSIARRRKK